MFSNLSRYQPQALAALRIVSAYLFLLHGSAKLLGGVLLVLGLFTRPVAFLLSGEMAVAYFMSHAKAAPRCCRCSTAARRRCCSASCSCTWCSPARAPGRSTISGASAPLEAGPPRRALHRARAKAGQVRLPGFFAARAPQPVAFVTV